MRLKRIFAAALSVMLIQTASFEVSAGNQTGAYRYNNFTYNVNSNNTISIISCDKDSIIASIPNEICHTPVTYINSEAFSDCGKLEKIYVESGNEYYTVSDGILFTKDKSRLIKCPAGAGKTSYFVPDEVTSICPGAFENCEELEFLSIPENVSSVGARAFRNTGFTSITVGEKTSLGEMSLGFADEKSVDNFTIYSKSGSAAEIYSLENSLNFIPLKSSDYTVKVNGNLYYYTEQKNFSGGNIVVTDKSGKPVSYAFSTSPAAVFKKYNSAFTKINIIDTSDNVIETVNVRAAVQGDANGDGKVNVRDAAMIARNTAQKYVYSGFEKFSADANGDGKVNVRDAALIARNAAKK